MSGGDKMKGKLARKGLLSVIAVALISLALWGLADGKSETTIAVLVFTGIILTTCIWFALAWQVWDAKPLEALPALAICLTPYLLTAGLDIYMAPYYSNDGGVMWAWILDSYGNILFNPYYHLLLGWQGQPMTSVAIIILMMQILLPFAFAFILKFIARIYKSKR